MPGLPPTSSSTPRDRLCSSARGTGTRPARSAASLTPQRPAPGAGRCRPPPAGRCVAARGQDVAGLDRLEGHGDRGPDGLGRRPRRWPRPPPRGCRRPPPGPRPPRGADRLGHRPPGGAARPGAEQPVQHQVGPASSRPARAGRRPDPPAGRPDQGHAAPPLLVEGVRVAGDQGLGPGPAAGPAGPGPPGRRRRCGPCRPGRPPAARPPGPAPGRPRRPTAAPARPISASTEVPARWAAASAACTAATVAAVS
jgi:hypothetical protein